MASDASEEVHVYPNSDLSAGKLALIAVVALACLAVWITGVFIAARPSRRQDAATGMTALPEQQREAREAHGKAA
jgi:3-deoxy-D-manno-octulosonic acid (KDO) 8-phosphate synthase